MKSDKMTSMRRKVIADSQSDRNAAKAASEQNATLDTLSDKLGDIQVQGELTSEVIEDKGNQIIETLKEVDQSIIDGAAGSELTAEAVEKTTAAVNAGTTASKKISEKLSKFTALLSDKLGLNPSTGTGLVPTESPVAPVESVLPEVVLPENLPEALGGLLPNPDDSNNNPDDAIFPPVPSAPAENEEDKKEKENKEKAFDELFKDLLKTTKSGFKSTISITDRIAGMLFKYTVTALAESAKLAGTLFAIVLAIDVIRTHFKYWSDKFMTDFNLFSTEAGKWGGLLSSIFGTLENIKQFWDDGDWGGLAAAIVKGIGKVIYNLSELISLGMSKVAATILSVIPGMDGAALSLEGAALEGFQERTGNSLSDKEQDTLAKYQSSKVENGEDAFDKVSRFKTKAWNWVTGNDDKGNYYTNEEKDAENDKLKAMSPEDRQEFLKKSNEARAAVVRFEKFMGDVNPNNKRQMETMDKAYGDLKSQLNDPALANGTIIKKELDGRMGNVSAKYEQLKSTEAKPAPGAQSDDAKKIDSIEKAKVVKEEAIKAKGGDQMNLVNTNNVINNSKTVNNQAPMTSSSAPGIFGATRVN